MARWRLEDIADLGEKIVFSAIFLYFLIEFSWSFIGNPNIITALYLADQTIILLFLLARRRPQNISMRPYDYAVAAAGTLLPLLAVPSSGQTIVPMAVCGVLALAGIFLHLAAKLSLRRSFGVVAADRGIKVEGPYRFIRHPMYLGYMLVHLALVLAGPIMWNVIVFAVTWLLYVLRIAAEERLLAQNEVYRTFQATTRFRLVPGLY